MEQHGVFPGWCVARSRQDRNEAGARGSGRGRNTSCSPLSRRHCAQSLLVPPSHVPCITLRPPAASKRFHNPPGLNLIPLPNTAVPSCQYKSCMNRQDVSPGKCVTESPGPSLGLISGLQWDLQGTREGVEHGRVSQVDNPPPRQPSEMALRLSASQCSKNTKRHLHACPIPDLCELHA